MPRIHPVPAPLFADPVRGCIRGALAAGAVIALAGWSRGLTAFAGGVAAGALITVASVWASARVVEAWSEGIRTRAGTGTAWGRALAGGKVCFLGAAVWAAVGPLALSPAGVAVGGTLLPVVFATSAILDLRASREGPVKGTAIG